MKVCTNCFNDFELKSFIESNSCENGRCDYCAGEQDSVLLDIEELLDFFAEFIEVFEEKSDGKPLIQLIKEDWDLFSGNTSANRILSDILNFIKSSISSPQILVTYIKEIIECTSYWEILKDELKWGKRYLTDYNKLFNLGWNSYFETKSKLPVNEKYFRARIHSKSGDTPYLEKQMGSPDKLYVSSGRANPLGIPYLYLSRSAETTLYETRAAFLDEISIAEFQIKDNEEIVLVDFTEDLSVFLYQNNIKEHVKSVILKKNISVDLSKPIRKRYDSELEYIPTQFICEFIKYEIGSDGILFNSSLHQGGKNIVLFNEDKVRCTSVQKHHVTKVSIESRRIS